MSSTSIIDTFGSEEIARCLFEASNDALFVFRPSDLSLIDVNCRGQQLTRLSRQQLLQQTVLDLFDAQHTSDFGRFVGACRTADVFRSGQPYQMVCGNDQTLPVNVTVNRLTGTSQPLGIVSAAELSDTERFESDTRCRESKDHFRTIFEQAAVGMALLEVNDGRFVKLNQKCLGSLGYQTSEIRQHAFVEFCHPDDIDALQANLAQLRCGRRSEFGMELRLVGKCGQWIWTDLTISTTSLDDAEPRFHIAIIEDITSRKRTEDQLEKSQRALQNAQRRACLGSWDYFPDTQETIWSQEMFRLYNRDPGDGTPQTIDEFVELVHRDDRESVRHRDDRIWQTDRPIENLDLRTNPALGPVRWLDSSVTRVPNQSMSGGFHLAGTVLDVTERKMAETALRESEHRYRTLVEHAPEAIVMFDPEEGKFVDFNDNALRFFKCDAETLRHAGLWDFSPPTQPDGRESIAASKANVRRALAGEYPVFEWVHRDTMGNDIPCEIRLLRLNAGARTLVRGSITDITDRKIVEARLKESERSLAKAQSIAHVGSWQYDLLSGKLTGSAELFRILWLSQESSMPDVDSILDQFVHPDDRQMIESAVRASLALGEVKSVEFRLVRSPSEPIRYVRADAEIVSDEAGNPEKIIGTLQDITEQKRVLIALSESETKFRGLSERSPAIVLIARSGRFVYCNANVLAITRYSEGELLGMDIAELIHPDHRELVTDRHNRRLSGEDVLSRYEGMIITKFGDVRWWAISATAIDYEGERAILAICMDVTDRKQAEQRLRERESQLAHVSRLSTMGEMVAGIAHEVNQPLYSIVNYSKATSNAIKDPTPDRLLQIESWNEQIGKAATRAGQIIKRLRGFVQHKTTRVPTDLHEIIGDAFELVRHEASRTGISIRANLPQPGPVVYVDHVQIQQVLVNLLVNAIEAIEQHDSRVREINVTTSSTNGQIQVAVEDTGPGLSWDNERNMFDAFETTKPNGLGMGLAISKTIIESFGGRLWAASNADGGARFHFTLPLETKVREHVS